MEYRIEEPADDMLDICDCEECLSVPECANCDDPFGNPNCGSEEGKDG